MLHFSAEQIDGAALAIASIESGKAFINGYQTGIGKGRICAAVMRYAQQEGKEAIFVTQNAGLYADMMRDTSDIGMTGFTPFLTDNGQKLDLPDGRTLHSAKGEVQMAAMQQIAAGGGDHDAIFTTYTQLQSVKGAEPYRRNFLREIAPRSILILDEAHEAGGSTQGEFIQKNSTPNRAEFVRELVDLSSGAYFSSATAIKRPDVIDLYARKTDLREAIDDDITQLTTLLESGGVPFQQMVAAGLTEGGDMMRLERSMAGIAFNPQVVPVNQAMAENMATAMRSIREFDAIKSRAVREIDQDLKEVGDRIRSDHAVGDRGMSSTNFTSVMHNVIAQSLMGMKAEATVQVCIEALERGEKPVIAVDNTMASFIEWYSSEHEVQPGESIDIGFNDLLQRYLDRSREVLVEDWSGTSQRRPLNHHELGESGMAAYVKAMQVITQSDFADVAISPIDYIQHRLQAAGYRVGEVTGRKHILNYQADRTTIYATRSVKDSNTNAKRETVRQFNSGELDVVILNRSGATGISLHASETFIDQRPRHMIILQPAGDINQVMQMFGRINRTGQVELPIYTMLMSDLPAEKRPGAVLAKKMASLNANTTAARESDMSLQGVVDFFNPYGEYVVASILEEEPGIDAALGHPYEDWLKQAQPGGLIEKVTGRIPLLPIAEQERLYERIETGYREFLESQRTMGSNDLEAGKLDLDARTISMLELSPATKPGPFTGAVQVEILDVKAGKNSFTQAELLAALRQQLELAPDADQADIQSSGTRRSTQLKQDLASQALTYGAMQATDKDAEAAAKLNDRLAEQVSHVHHCLEHFPIGTAVAIQRNSSQSLGIVTHIEHRENTKNPAAASSWRMKIAVSDTRQPIAVNFSQINRHDGRGLELTNQNANQAWILDGFDQNQGNSRTELQMVTGNLIPPLNNLLMIEQYWGTRISAIPH